MCPHKTSPFLCRADVTAPITLRQVLRAVGRLRAEPFLQRPKPCSCSLTSFLTASRMMLSRLRSMQMLESSTVLRHRIIHMITYDTHRAHSCMRYDHPYLQHYPRIQDSPPTLSFEIIRHRAFTSHLPGPWNLRVTESWEIT